MLRELCFVRHGNLNIVIHEQEESSYRLAITYKAGNTSTRILAATKSKKKKQNKTKRIDMQAQPHSPLLSISRMTFTRWF